MRPSSLRFWPDLVPAGTLLVLGELEAALSDPSSSHVVLGALTLALTVPLALRCHAPLAVLAWTVAIVAALTVVEPDTSQAAVPLALMLAVYTVGRELELGPALLGLALPVAAFAVALAAAEEPVQEFAIGAALYATPWGFGRALRARGRHVEALTAHAERLEREREQQEQAAVAAERARIARELHDIVSHSISVVALQTEAVRRRLAPEQQSERRDLRAVETTARQAMAEMRRLFGVLRAEGSPPALAPQPGLDQLERLLTDIRATGLMVALQLEGKRTALPPGVDLAAYRIVQEALTNARRHARGAPAFVRLRFRERDLEIIVEDRGDGPSANGSSRGHGLIGMRERVALYGGSFEAGPRPQGGFRVRARLPIGRGSQA
ncbi:MAG: sensor histidine kinase [Thermoleophilaceae bacterium]|nr:sensor histidine kinase [Thermoleophilaceae bacterium]